MPSPEVVFSFESSAYEIDDHVGVFLGSWRSSSRRPVTLRNFLLQFGSRSRNIDVEPKAYDDATPFPNGAVASFFYLS